MTEYKRFKQSNTIIVGILVCAVLGLGSCIGVATPEATPASPQTPEAAQVQRVTILSDSFVLERMDHANQLCLEEPDYATVEYPVNQCGVYISEPFFVMNDEIFELVVTADCPVGYARGEASGGIYVCCDSSYGPHPYGTWTLQFDLLESSPLGRTDSRFARTFVIKSDKETGGRWYHILLYNEGSESFRCEYVLSLMK
jgi:hypothetical protein